jgi:hypothetical protein
MAQKMSRPRQAMNRPLRKSKPSKPGWSTVHRAFTCISRWIMNVKNYSGNEPAGIASAAWR